MKNTILAERKNRIAIILSDVAPLRIPFFNYLATNNRFDITILYHDNNRPGHNWQLQLKDAKFNIRRLPCIKIYFRTSSGDVWPRHIPVGLAWELLRGRYDVIISINWTELFTILSLAYGKLSRTPVVLWEDSISHPTNRLKQFLSPIIRRLFAAYDATIAQSSRSRDYLIEWGAKPDAGFLSYYHIDTRLFPANSSEVLFLSDRLKHTLGLGNRRVILFVGQFIPRKGIIELLNAFRKLTSRLDDVVLLMVGDGPMGRKIDGFAAANGLKDRILMSGYVQPKDLPGYYALSDLFVLPSHYESFGATIAEAMTMGLPVITTQMVGASPDWVQNGVNGFVIPPADCEALYHSLYEIFCDENRRQQMADASLRIISGLTLEKAAQGFYQAIDFCLASKEKRI